MTRPAESTRRGWLPREDGPAVLAAALWAAGAAAAGRWGLWLGVGGLAVVLGAALLLGDPARLRALLRPTPARLLGGLIAGLAMAGVTCLLYPTAARAWPWLARDTADLYRAFRALPPGLAALLLGPIVLGEELVWRQLVQGALVRRIGVPAGVGVAAAAYALAHVGVGSPLLVAVAFGCGLAWGALRAGSHAMVPPIVAHLVWDGCVLLLWPLVPA